jgi:hypothetical protein
MARKIFYSSNIAGGDEQLHKTALEAVRRASEIGVWGEAGIYIAEDLAEAQAELDEALDLMESENS